MQEADGTTEGAAVPERDEHPQSGRDLPDPGLARIREAAAGVWDDPWLTLPNALSVLQIGRAHV